jgi:uncharacterized membrane protein
MSNCGHLWAIGFDDPRRAARFREEITRLGWEKHDLILRDIAVAVRFPDGSFTLNGEPFSFATSMFRGTLASFLAGLALSVPPLTSSAVDFMLASVGCAAAEVGISDDFVREVGALVKLETSIVFVLDEVGNMDAILHAIRGLGGTVLKTNVDLERAKLIQSTLAASAGTTQSNDLQKLGS